VRRIVLAAAGDVLVDRTDPRAALEQMNPILDAADVAFGNFEGVLTDVHAPTAGSAHATVVPSSNAESLCAFSVISLANNHTMDAGYGGLSDTIDTLTRMGITPVGAGFNLNMALRPAILERNGLRIALMAVSSVMQVGAEATVEMPGVAPLRADDYYAAPFPGLRNPGLSPRVVSVPNENDAELVSAAIRQARREADVLVVSVHWGDFTQPWTITTHERTCGKWLIEAGAHVVIGHHHHFMRGIEFHAGGPVLYGLGHLVFDHPRFLAEMRMRGRPMDGVSEAELAARFGEYGIYPRAATPTLPFHPLTRHTGIAVVELTASGVGRVGLAPGRIEPDGTPRPVQRGGSDWEEALTFHRRCATKPGLATEIVDSGWTYSGHDLIEFQAGSVGAAGGVGAVASRGEAGRHVASS
jgi:hypothetical protein